MDVLFECTSVTEVLGDIHGFHPLQLRPFLDPHISLSHTVENKIILLLEYFAI